MQQPGNKTQRRIWRSGRIGQDKFILIKRNRVHFWDSGKGEAVVLVARTYSSHRIWNRLSKALAAEFHLIEPDYKVASASVETHTDLIAEMVKQMGIGKVHLIGAPTGGPVVFDFAARYPDRVNKIISLQGGVFAPPPSVQKPSSRTWLNFTFGPSQAAKLENRAKSIKAPILYIYGTASDIDVDYPDKNIDFLNKYLSHAWIVGLDSGIHEISRRSPEEISDLILVFLHSNLT